MDSSTTENYGLGDPLMLQKVDKLFTSGVGDLIDLPQVVVVGDQSSGKSSVLEGLIGKPLPRDSGLCTRFATQIVFRRSAEEGISISIIADPQASAEERKKVDDWKRADVSLLDSATFSSIMEEARDVMGLSTSDHPLGKTFSNHVLRLEIAGPDQEHLSVIDVPGIFRIPTQGVTTKSDIALVRNMVLGYMENPRSVMLTVVPANVDVATQEILELAAEVDPEGDRTLGVLTKPDLVDPGAEPRVIDLIEDRGRQMKLGWHVVRNPGQQQLLDGSLDRHALELQFFQTVSPWKGVSSEKVGIEALRSRIKDVLSSLVKREFPKVKQEVTKRLTKAQKSLDALGRERSTSHAQTAYLTEIATQFQRLVTLALDAKYGSDESFDQNSSMRLATLITLRTEEFSKAMASHGQEFQFLPNDESASESTSERPMSPVTPPEASCSNKTSSPITVRRTEDYQPDIEDILHSQTTISEPSEDSIEAWLSKVYDSSRGFELGTFHPTILATTMKRQSSKWVDISLGYMSDVVATVHRFIGMALDTVCHDGGVKQALSNMLMDGLCTRYRKAISHVEFLLEVERNGTPMTTNHYFNENLEKRRQSRMMAALSAFSFSGTNPEYGKLVKVEDAMQSNYMSNPKHTVRDIHDILQSYYKVALKRYVDNVLKQATDHFLVSGPETPLKLFSPVFINSLTPDELEHIAGEAPKSKRARVQLTKEIASLTEARTILQRG